MKEERDSKHREFMKDYNSIRKPMPPPDKTIKPKVEFKREHKRWQEWLEDEDNDLNMNQPNRSDNDEA
jgi:hypothetical protein